MVATLEMDAVAKVKEVVKCILKMMWYLTLRRVWVV
jgi:hypothetical protein